MFTFFIIFASDGSLAMNAFLSDVVILGPERSHESPREHSLGGEQGSRSKGAGARGGKEGDLRQNLMT